MNSGGLLIVVEKDFSGFRFCLLSLLHDEDDDRLKDQSQYIPKEETSNESLDDVHFLLLVFVVMIEGIKIMREKSIRGAIRSFLGKVFIGLSSFDLRIKPEEDADTDYGLNHNSNELDLLNQREGKFLQSIEVEDSHSCKDHCYQQNYVLTWLEVRNVCHQCLHCLRSHFLAVRGTVEVEVYILDLEDVVDLAVVV